MDERAILFYYFCFSDYNFVKRVKIFLKSAVLKYKINGVFDNVCFFNSMNRKDHKCFFDTVYDNFSGQKNLLYETKKIGINFSFFVLLLKNRKLKNKIKEVIYRHLKINVSKNTLACIYYMLIFEKLRINKFSKFDYKNIKSLVVLYDLGRTESNLITAIKQNDCNCKIISLQHGYFIESETVKNIDNLNVFFCQADYVLTWGEKTSEFFHRFNVKTYICGYPMINICNVTVDNKIIGIALDIPRNKDYNQKMIDIVSLYAKKHDCVLKIRKHPSDQHDYKFCNVEVIHTTNLDDCGIIVMHTTSMIFTYMASGKKIARFKSNLNFPELNSNIEFIDLKELERCINNDYDYEYIRKKFVYCIGDESLKLHDYYINKISNDK